MHDWYDDAARLVRTYDGRVETATRSYTAAENAAADAAAAEVAERAGREAQRATVRAIIDDLQVEKVNLDAVIAAATGDLRRTARAAKRIADAAIDLARFVKDD